MSQSALIKTALTGVMAAGLVAMSTAAVADAKEKCMGVAKAGKNDCATSQHACAGQSKVDNAKEEWVYVPTGTCVNLPGGVLKARKS